MVLLPGLFFSSAFEMNENRQGPDILGCHQVNARTDLCLYHDRVLYNTIKKKTYRKYLELKNLEFEQSALPRAGQRVLLQSIFATRKISNCEDKKRATRHNIGIMEKYHITLAAIVETST